MLRKYNGYIIRDCAWAGDPHRGKYLVQTYHESGSPWSDEQCPHYATLADAKADIRAWAAHGLTATHGA